MASTKTNSALKRRYCTGACLMMLAGVIYTVLAIVILCQVIIVAARGIAQDLAVPMVILTALGCAAIFAMSALLIVTSLKRLTIYNKSKKALSNGKEVAAVFHSRTAGQTIWSTPRKNSYSLTLKIPGGEECLVNTAAIYTQKQTEYLQGLSEIKVKYAENTAVVVEEFPE